MKRRKLLFNTKNREAWSLFSAKLVYSDHLQAQRLTPALRDGADLESLVTGAEAPAYYQAVSPRRYRGRGRPRHNVGRTSSPVRLLKTALEIGQTPTNDWRGVACDSLGVASNAPPEFGEERSDLRIGYRAV